MAREGLCFSASCQQKFVLTGEYVQKCPACGAENVLQAAESRHLRQSLGAAAVARYKAEAVEANLKAFSAK